MKKAKEDWIGIQTFLISAREFPAGEKSNFNVDHQLSRASLGDVLQKNSADGQNIVQHHTTMRAMATVQFWTAISPQKNIYDRFFEKKLRLQ